MIKLASLLRFSLNAQQAGLVPLRQEMKIVRAYPGDRKAVRVVLPWQV